MRISDWSSDVCSSDLPAPASPLPPAIEKAIGGKNAYVITPEGNDLYTLHVRRSKGLPETFTGLSEPQALIYVREKLRRFVGFHGAPEIGRASCRERVCPTV